MGATFVIDRSGNDNYFNLCVELRSSLEKKMVQSMRGKHVYLKLDLLIWTLNNIKSSQQTPSEENIDSMMEFSKFYKRFILSKVYDPKFIGLKDG